MADTTASLPALELERRVRERQLDDAMRGMLSNGPGGFVSALGITLLTVTGHSWQRSATYLCLVALVSASWMLASLAYRRRAARPITHLRPWLLTAYLLAFVHGIVWGSMPLVLGLGDQSQMVLIMLWVLGAGAAQLLAQTTLPFLYLTCFGPIYVWLGVTLALYSSLSVRAVIAIGVYCAFLLVLSRQLTARITSAVRLGFEHEALSQNLATAVLDLEAASKRLSELSVRDELTGIFNRRYLFEILAREMERVRRHPAPVSVLLLDIDHFKRVNDEHGHHAGDEVLRRFAKVAQKEVRSVDVLARYGGEEFSVLCTQTPAAAAGALVVAERVRKAIEETAFDDVAKGLHVTVSIGVATYRPGESATELYVRADEALYRAKRAGRNRVEGETRG